VLRLVNNHRVSIGRAPFSTSASLTSAAVWKARHMASYRYMSHNDPAPPVARSWLDRVHTCGYPTSAGAGENIAYRYRTPAEVVNAWLGSPGAGSSEEAVSTRGRGLLLRPASSIHTWFMRFPIDAVFVGADGTVVRIAGDLQPWRAAGRRGARAVLELPAGECERCGLKPGDRLIFA
jgi:hypothetical protein